MAKLIMEVKVMTKEQLKEIVGNKLEEEFKKNPLIKPFIKVYYE